MNNTYGTSLNQVPALVKGYEALIEGIVLNYGCGRGYKKVEEFLPSCKVVSYDKYSDNDEINTLDESYIYDTVVCANVLNVIEDYTEMYDALEDIMRVVNGKAFFSIYEGDRSGIGKVTTKGYQRNEKAVNYEPILKKFFDKVIRRGNCFECSN